MPSSIIWKLTFVEIFKRILNYKDGDDYELEFFIEKMIKKYPETIHRTQFLMNNIYLADKDSDYNFLMENTKSYFENKFQLNGGS